MISLQIQPIKISLILRTKGFNCQYRRFFILVYSFFRFAPNQDNPPKKTRTWQPVEIFKNRDSPRSRPSLLGCRQWPRRSGGAIISQQIVGQFCFVHDGHAPDAWSFPSVPNFQEYAAAYQAYESMRMEG
jgi:hypothetical protein